MKVTVKVEGLRELDEALGQFTKATAKGVLRRVGLKALQPVADTAIALAPDDPDTGGNDLRHSISVGTKLSKNQARLSRKAIAGGEADKHFVEVYAGVDPRAPQGVWQEFGTGHHGPQPFMRPAWDQNKAGVLETIKTDLGAEIEKTAQRVAKRAAAKAAKAAR